jgi:hypothetical protein
LFRHYGLAQAVENELKLGEIRWVVALRRPGGGGETEKFGSSATIWFSPISRTPKPTPTRKTAPSKSGYVSASATSAAESEKTEHGGNNVTILQQSHRRHESKDADQGTGEVNT